ncbi:methyltransferase domain-containing protein [Sphaerisporangium viridialbum]|uniref:methyltransferase domain-containing protein n=1 Tax=Sphaerisporangium viridialbum TaxID=46189 RepID=UPI003C7680F3
MRENGQSIDSRIDGLVNELTARGAMGEGWREAMHAAPRHLFLPYVAWAMPYGQPAHVIDRHSDAAGWLGAAYADHPVVTQVDDGRTDIREAETGNCFSSSLSAPGAVMSFLDLLSPYSGDKVLEVGTGTGWTAALLSHRVGETNVTSIEIDETVSAIAAENLKLAGHSPRLMVGDGLAGYPEGAPYDRVHVTCGVYEIPYSWVEQTRPGGLIVLPWSPPFESGHNLALTVTNKGTAVGRFSGGSSYMMARSQRHPDKPPLVQGRRSETAADSRRILRAGYGADVTIAALMPGVWSEYEYDQSSMTLRLWDPNSLALIEGSDVHQYGERSLWDELEDAFFAWVEWGSPDRDRFGMTVTPEGQFVWHDTPDNPVAGHTR